MEKFAETEHAIHELLKGRWSPRAFASQPVEREKILSLFEAARWSPSAANTQPWSFVAVTNEQPERHQKFVETLTGNNQAWAGNAPVLVLTVARPNPDRPAARVYAFYDLGQSVAHLNVQAEALGLQVHQMGGFDKEKARELFEIPEGYEPMTVIAIGYPGNPEELPEELRERELSARSRKQLSDFVFEGHWNSPLEAGELSLSGSI